MLGVGNLLGLSDHRHPPAPSKPTKAVGCPGTSVGTEILTGVLEQQCATLQVGPRRQTSPTGSQPKKRIGVGGHPNRNNEPYSRKTPKTIDVETGRMAPTSGDRATSFTPARRHRNGQGD